MTEETDDKSRPKVPGSSDPGEPGYEGRVTVGDEGAVEDAWEKTEPMAGEAPTG
jgi:hypothetical protein